MTRGPVARLALFAFIAALPAGAEAETGFGPAPSCLRHGKKSEEHCVGNDGLTIEAFNGCDRTLDVQICIGRRNGKIDCVHEPVRTNRSFSYYVCQPNWKYAVRARLVAEQPRPRPQRPAACPDQYFRDAQTGQCVKCDGIWANGQCIYD
jgi:hypothetical protein